MSSLAVETRSEISVNLIIFSEEFSNLNTAMTARVNHHSEDADLSGEEYWDELDDYDYENWAGSARLPRQGHELKHGKLIEKRGSSQEKFISSRPKALVKYRKQLFTATADDIDEKAKEIIKGFVGFVDVSATILSGVRSVLIHVPAQLNKTTGEREEYLIKVYKQQFGVDRANEWLLKEHFNAIDMWDYANIPKVFHPTRNVGQLRFIGDDGIPAPNLDEVPFEITEKIYEDVVNTMYKLYNQAKVVHGKLSAKTILWWRDKLWLMSLSHAVPTSDPKALQNLMKDCCHITYFFKHKGLPKVKSIMNLFKHVTGLEKVDDDVLHTLRNTRKPVKHRQKRRQPQG